MEEVPSGAEDGIWTVFLGAISCSDYESWKDPIGLDRMRNLAEVSGQSKAEI